MKRSPTDFFNPQPGPAPEPEAGTPDAIFPRALCNLLCYCCHLSRKPKELGRHEVAPEPPPRAA